MADKEVLTEQHDQKIKHAFKWSLIEVILLNVLSVFTMVFLARLVAPKDFGLLTPVYLITTIVSGFIDSGLSGAIIRFQDISKKAISSAFWFIIFVAFITALLLSASSWVIADFYDNDMLQIIIVVFAANLLIGSFGSIPKTLMAKNFQNKITFQITAVSTVVSSSITIWMAYSGMGVWAIITQIVLQSVVQTIGFYCFCNWRPMFYFNFKELKQYLGYGYYFTVIGYVNAAYKYAGAAILGRYLGFTYAGIYNQADRIQQIVTEQVVNLIQRIAFPTFSRISNDPDALKQAYLTGFRHMMFTIIPAMVGMLSIAHVLIPTVFGENWIAGVPVLRILCLAGVFGTMEVYDMIVIKSVGSASVFFRLETIKRLISLVLVVLVVQFGMIWLAVVFTTLIFAGLVLNSFYVNKLLGISFYDRILYAYRPVLAGIIMWLAVYIVNVVWQSNGILVLVALIFTGVSAYGMVNFLINRSYIRSLMSLR